MVVIRIIAVWPQLCLGGTRFKENQFSPDHYLPIQIREEGVLADIASTALAVAQSLLGILDQQL